VRRKLPIVMVASVAFACAESAVPLPEDVHAEAAQLVAFTPGEPFTDPIVRLHTDSMHAAGLVYRAATMLRYPADSLAQLHTTITLMNVWSDSLVTLLDGCTVLMRLYDPRSSSTEAVWAEGTGSGWRCAQRPFLLPLAPGESRTFSREIPVHWFLVDGLAPGRYTVSALLRHVGEALEFEAGEAVLQPQHAGLRARVDLILREEDTSFHALAWIVNESTEPIPLELPGCALRLFLYHTAEMHGPPRWQWTQHTRGARECPPTDLERHTLAPGDSLSSRFLWAGLPVARVLGDSLPPGSYHVQAQLRFNYFDAERISLGAVDLYPSDSSHALR
jgi:hypothetical protein